MLQFYIFALLLVFVALLFIVIPLFKARKQQKIELSNANVIKQRMRELEQEVEEGLIDEEEKDATIKELKLALIDETPDVDDRPQISSASSGKRLILLGIPALVVGAWVYYDSNQLGGLVQYKQSMQDVDEIRTKMQEDGGNNLDPNDFAKLALSIRSSLRENPNDAQGWSYLALVNTSIGRVDEGIAAYEKALDLAPQDDALRFKYAETLMLSGTDNGLENAKRQLGYLINKQPENRNYRLLITLVAIQLQELELALANFNLIKDQLRADQQFYQSLVSGLNNIGADLEIASSSVAAQGNIQNSVAEGTSEILIDINVSSALREKIPANAYLVVFAQNTNSESRAPLAVTRMNLSELPTSVKLSDNDAMIANMNLSSADLINVTARISKDQDVTPKSGDLEGTVAGIELVKGSAKNIAVTIDRELNL